MSRRCNQCHDVRVQKLYRASGASIVVPPGIPIKPVIRGEVPVGQHVVGALEGEEIAWVSFRLEYSEISGRFEIASFGIDRGDHDYEISGAFFRTVKVHTITNLSLTAALPSWGIVVREMARDRVRALARGLPTFKPGEEDAQLLTAMVYRIAEISGENPVQAVADAFGLKIRTATNWIQRARASGYMTSTEHPRDARRAARRIEPYFRAGDDMDAVADELTQQTPGDDPDGDD